MVGHALNLPPERFGMRLPVQMSEDATEKHNEEKEESGEKRRPKTRGISGGMRESKTTPFLAAPLRDVTRAALKSE
jgi:hypothetical protein